MKKNITRVAGIIMIAVLIAACSNTDSKVDPVIQSQMQEEDVTEEKLLVLYSTDDAVDVDLTKLSSTMVYSEVYNMIYLPENYIGKTVKMTGMFVAYTNEDMTQFYPAVIIADATACCSQGMEFILEENSPYPEGYPEMGTNITVIGTFETYQEDGNLFCRLQNAKIL